MMMVKMPQIVWRSEISTTKTKVTKCLISQYIQEVLRIGVNVYVQLFDLFVWLNALSDTA